MLHSLLMLIPFKMMMAKPDSTKLILGNTLAVSQRSNSLWRKQLVHSIASNLVTAFQASTHYFPFTITKFRLFWLRCPKSASMLSMFTLRCLPRCKYSDVVMLLWYHLVPWNTDLSSCWRTMPQESHHWFPSIGFSATPLLHNTHPQLKEKWDVIDFRPAPWYGDLVALLPLAS